MKVIFMCVIFFFVGYMARDMQASFNRKIIEKNFEESKCILDSLKPLE